MDALPLILDTLAPLSGRTVLDVGCGSGTLAKALVDGGAIVTGIDPNGDAVAAATRAVPDATFLKASAEDLPLPASSFTAAVFMNSLHHVPDPRAALRDVGRVLQNGAPIIVVEPLAEGNYFDVLRLIDDETEVRAAAQTAVQGAIRDGEVACTHDEVFDRIIRFKTIDDLLARSIAVDPERAGTIAANRKALVDIFERASDREDGHYVLRQPLRAQVLITQRA